MVNIFESHRPYSRWIVLLAVAAFSIVAACSSDNPDPTATSTAQVATSPTPSATSTSVPAATPTPSAASSATATTAPSATPTQSTLGDFDLQVLSVDGFGDIIVDREGMTLYIFDNDTEGVSNCSGGCLNAWPPLIVDSTPEVGPGINTPIRTIQVEAGLQVTINGFPAYYWAGDSAPGDALGNGVNNVWWVFNPDGTPQRPAKVSVLEDDEHGEILVDGEGLTLYIFDRDTEGVSNCAGGCLTAWPPLLAEYGVVALSGVSADIGTIDRGNGVMQVTVNGFPAYYWASDRNPGETLGNAVGGNWWVFNPDGTPQRPAKVGVVEDDEHGDILVDGAGRALYIFDNDTEGVSNCSDSCLTNWPPLLTNYDPIALSGVDATIGTIVRADNTVQVTINGFPAYYWVGDAAAGDTLGNGRGGNWWVFSPDGTPQRPAKVGLFDQQLYDNILVGPNGLTLYVFESDTVGVSNCSGGCLIAWPPLLTEHPPVALSGVEATLGTITRDDGTMQVTVNGLPVYYWQNDVAPGDINGHGRNQLWWVIAPDGTPWRAP